MARASDLRAALRSQCPRRHRRREFPLEIRMGDANERLRPFPHTPPVQHGHAELRHDVMHIGPGRHDTGAGPELRDDSRHRAVPRGRRQSDDRPPALRIGRPPDEIHLPAEPAVDLRADRIGADLAGEIDL
jgi:hypothetical protein